MPHVAARQLRFNQACTKCVDATDLDLKELGLNGQFKCCLGIGLAAGLGATSFLFVA